jgi:hypothetical protein
MIGIAIACLLVAISGLCTLIAWRHASRTKALDKLGREFGVGKWPGESNNDYADRIIDRIRITGKRRMAQDWWSVPSIRRRP